MGKIYQTGYLQNCEGLFKLYGMILAQGADWTPADSSLTAANILVKHDEIDAAIGKFFDEAVKWAALVNFRGNAMKAVNPLLTRVNNEVQACNVTPEFKADVKSRVKNIQGVRATPKLKTLVAEPGVPEGVPTEDSIEQISAAQTGIDDKLGHLGELIGMLENEPNYTTQIDLLKVANLKLWLIDLKKKNDDVNLQKPVMDVKRNARNKSMYEVDKGGNELASKIRNSFKSIFGGDSVEFHAAAKIKFTTPKK